MFLGIGPIIPLGWTMVCLLLAAIADTRSRRIPNSLVGMAAPAALLTGASFTGELSGATVLGAIFGGAAFLGGMLAIGLLTKGVGGGDIKLGGVVGLMLSWPSAMAGFVIVWIGAGFVGSVRRDRALPMAPLMLVAAAIGLLIRGT